MFVPSPFCTVNGSAKIPGDAYTKASVQSRTPELALSSLGSASSGGTSSDYMGSRSRAGRSGYIFGTRVETAYTNSSLDFKSSAGKYMEKHRTKSYYRAYEAKPGFGFVGSKGYGVGSPLLPMDLNSTLRSPMLTLAVQHAEQKAENAALMGTKTQQIDLTETLVGIPQTINDLADKAISVRNSLVALRKGRILDAFKLLGYSVFGREASLSKITAKSWLYYIYAIKPLISDIASLMELVTDGIKPRPNPFKQRGSAWHMPPRHHSVTGSGTSTPFMDFLTGFGSDMNVTSKTVECTVSSRVVFRYDFEESLVSKLVYLLGMFGLDSPSYAVWVKTPWSFVVDWFLPVGEFLQLVSTGMHLRFVDGYRVTVVHGKMSERGTPKPSSGYDIHTVFSEHSWEGQVYSMQRTPLYTTPNPNLYLNLNPFKSNQRRASALALLRNLH